MTFDELEKCLIEEFGDSDTNDLADLVWIARGESAGLCVACKTVAFGVEPDARRYKCDACGKSAVFGIEELIVTLGG